MFPAKRGPRAPLRNAEASLLRRNRLRWALAEARSDEEAVAHIIANHTASIWEPPAQWHNLTEPRDPKHRYEQDGDRKKNKALVGQRSPADSLAPSLQIPQSRLLTCSIIHPRACTP